MTDSAKPVPQGFVSSEVVETMAGLMSWPSVDAARALPGFSDMSRALAHNWRLPDDEEDRFFAQNLRDLGRFIGSLYALYLHSTEGGLTRSRLAGLLEATNLSGPGRAQALLIFLQFISYIKPAPAGGGDGRVRRFVPTPRVVQAFTRRLINELRAMQTMNPAIAGTLASFDKPGASELYIELMAECFLSFMVLRNPTGGPSLEIFSQRYAGMMLLGELLATAAPDDVFPPKGPMRYSTAALARKSGISRTQVRRALREAADLGFLELPEEGLALPTDMLRLHLEHTTAGQLIGATWAAEQFMERFGQQQRLRA